jgi:hypothetical protein
VGALRQLRRQRGDGGNPALAVRVAQYATLIDKNFGL